MADNTAIEWADATWTPIRARRRDTGKVGHYCAHVSDGCALCYAERINRRLGTGIDYRAQDLDLVEVFVDKKALAQPLHWRRPRRIFVCSMTDLFGEWVPDDWIDQVFAVMAQADHTFVVLTKRASRMREYLATPSRSEVIGWAEHAMLPGPIGKTAQYHGPQHLRLPLPNVWLLVSVEDQRRADERIPELLATPAAVRGISAEPLLGPIDLEGGRGWLHGYEENGIDMSRPIGEKVGACIGWTPPLDWVICGGESGPGARPMHADWARSLRNECTAAGIPFFFKQWGEWRPGTAEDTDYNIDPRDRAAVGQHANMIRVGKRAAGRLLDGRTWDEFPNG